jgi:hypothetical protein
MDKIKKKDIQIDKKLFYKMIFLYNSLNSGWMIKKQNEEYIFTKPHENKKEIYNDEYISQFVIKNMDVKDLF